MVTKMTHIKPQKLNFHSDIISQRPLHAKSVNQLIKEIILIINLYTRLTIDKPYPKLIHRFLFNIGTTTISTSTDKPEATT